MYKIKNSFIALAILIGALTLAPRAFAQSSAWSTPVNLNFLPDQITPINGQFADQHPAISKDGLSLYFMSDRSGMDSNGRPISCGGLDIWVTQRDCVGCPWGVPFNLDRDRLAQGLACVINSSANDFAPNLTPDGHLLFLHSYRSNDNCGGGDVYYAQRENPGDNLGWEAPRNLNRFGRDSAEGLICGGIGDLNLVNTPNTDGAPSYFYDAVTGATVLYFTRGDRPTEAGDIDIYTATLGADGTWGTITRSNELSTTPYRDTRMAIRHDGLEIILTSERPGFPPGSDPRKLWFSTRASTRDPWSIPVLVPNVNSTSRDGAPALSWDGNELYFFSARAGGFGGNDLYRSTRTLPLVKVKNITLEADSSCSATINPGDLDDGSFDPDGGVLALSLDPAGPFGLGPHTVRLIATNNQGVTNSALASVTVVDQTPPTITAPPAVTIATGPGATSCGALVSDAVLGTQIASDNCSVTVTRSGVPAGNFFPVGTTIITYTAIDGASNTAYATQNVTVLDDTPPVITGASVDKPTLWPPSHQMVDVAVSYTATDNCGAVNTGLSISSNEQVNGPGDGNTAADWEIVDARHVRLRAERSGQGSGRVYMITITATDRSGNTSNQTVSVMVPHN